MRGRALQSGASAGVIGFDPHPGEVLSPGGRPRRLTTREQQARLFTELGLSWCWLLPFSPTLASLTPTDFVELLVETIPLRELWLGRDFRFGRDRAGDLQFLRLEGERRGFAVEMFSPVERFGAVISSTRVRTALADGDVELASELLGRPFALEGMVVAGRGEGARLLVATANLELAGPTCLPARGVYAGWAEVAGRLVASVTNVGVRPTLTEDTRESVEVHLLDWTGDLRGAPLAVHFVSRLRAEKRFEGIDALRRAVADDIGSARRILSEGPRAPEPAFDGPSGD